MWQAGWAHNRPASFFLRILYLQPSSKVTKLEPIFLYTNLYGYHPVVLTTDRLYGQCNTTQILHIQSNVLRVYYRLRSMLRPSSGIPIYGSHKEDAYK